MDRDKKKDLFKPGRPIDEYLDEKGQLRRYCLTCIHRRPISECSCAGWLCRLNDKVRKSCMGDDAEYHKLWEPRVEASQHLTAEDFELD